MNSKKNTNLISTDNICIFGHLNFIMKYKLSHFAYNLPEKLIAKRPAVDRDSLNLWLLIEKREK